MLLSFYHLNYFQKIIVNRRIYFKLYFYLLINNSFSVNNVNIQPLHFSNFTLITKNT
ncbi:hypothetical protein FD45_GL001702 [Liquorilactobacillus nagelii DSM 13675]|nr:hypothetical protein FD45_GL001702 [Liquorilactobacillus nagelii DSM 13675]